MALGLTRGKKLEEGVTEATGSKRTGMTGLTRVARMMGMTGITWGLELLGSLR